MLPTRFTQAFNSPEQGDLAELALEGMEPRSTGVTLCGSEWLDFEPLLRGCAATPRTCLALDPVLHGQAPKGDAISWYRNSIIP